jgi:predicted aspartyl protease
MIRFQLSGFYEQMPQEFEGMIDTGFSGFLLLPLLKALPVGLVLASTANYTLADNSVHTTLLCIGHIRLDDGSTVSGMVSVTNADADVLLGVDSLKKAGRSLHFAPTHGIVELNQVQRSKE